MKKLLQSIVILLSVIFQIQAQNYQTFNSGRIASYEDQWNVIKFVRIDSVNFQTDSVLMPFGGFQEISYQECYIIDGVSWLGKEIIVHDNGWNLFVTSEEDTVHINTAVTQGETWTAFHRPGQLIITATLISHDVQNFLGLQDSVKTIGFQAYNHLMEPINHAINSMTVALSKNFGFVRTLNFALFPDIYPYIGNDWDGLREFELIGLSDPQVGVQNLTWMEVHDFQPGDEFHVYYFNATFFAPNELQQTIQRYLDREDFADSVRYSVERIQSTLHYSYQGNTFEFIHDTIIETYRPNEDFDKLPGEIVFDEDWADGAFYYKLNTQWHQAKIKPSPDFWLFNSGEYCWNYLIIDGCISDYTWYKGLGGPYHNCDFWGEIERSLVYYKKGSETWGTPLVIVGMEENQPKNGINIYPNPATDKLWIMCEDTDLPLTVEFYDLHGRLAKEVVLSETVQQIGLQEFTRGFYSYRIYNDAGLTGFGKVVIE
ncbi:MAG: T9SS type A sorting domain-containing protein [Bacteroidales bacterium]|nr:T9SS type A sorting domain-containing protein [Bacteroidales bacterium]